MRLGYNTNGFTSHSLADALEVIAGLGYRSVGLTVDHHALSPLRAEWRASAVRCREQLKRLNLLCVLETGARYLLDPWRKHQPTLLDPLPEARARREEFLEAVLDLAAVLEAPVVSLWSGAAPPGAAPAVLDAHLAAALQRLSVRAAARGVVLAFEPEPGMHVATMADYERIRAQVPHPSFRLTLDVGHAHLTESEGAVATVRRFRDQIANVHLEGMQRPRHDHLLPGEGDLDLAGVLRALDEIGYGGPATYELSRHSHDAVEVARRAFLFAAQARTAHP